MQQMEKGYLALMQPMKAEMGLMRPVFSLDAAWLSLQLASLAYTLDMDPWRQDGWQDVSYHVDNALLTGEAANGGGGGRLPGLMSEYRQFLTRFKAKSANLVSQVLGTMRQREQSDTCKAVVMARRQENGKYLVAIGFMGTGKRVHDWIANFRFASEDGLHQGCLQLTRHFEESLDEIVFEKTARELALEKLTLRDIINECRRPDSRFKLWMAGHSQGGAVMQIFAYRAMMEGVLRGNMIGYGFASPSVLYGENKMDAGSVPLFHILNGDDLVCRLGAKVHFGICYGYRPTEKMRLACYASAWTNSQFRQVLGLVQQIRGNEDAILFLLGLISALKRLDDKETVEAVSVMLGKFLPERMTGLLGGRMEDGLQYLSRYAEQTYRNAFGVKPLPEAAIRNTAERITVMFGQMGARGFVRCLLQALAIPHRMREKEDYGKVIPAYSYIVRLDGENLVRQITPAYPSAGKAARKKQVLRKQAYGRFGRRI